MTTPAYLTPAEVRALVERHLPDVRRVIDDVIAELKAANPGVSGRGRLYRPEEIKVAVGQERVGLGHVHYDRAGTPVVIAIVLVVRTGVVEAVRRG